MAKATNTTTNSKEEIKTRKYIVEAPEPKKGQKVSSGGIRENGKLAAQFKNPVPYKEPTLPPSVVTQRSNVELARKEQAKARRNKAGIYFLSIVWQEFDEAILRTGLRKLGDKIINRIESPTTQSIHHISSTEPEVIDVEADEIETVYDDDKIIRFYNRKVISSLLPEAATSDSRAFLSRIIKGPPKRSFILFYRLSPFYLFNRSSNVYSPLRILEISWYFLIAANNTTGSEK